VALFQRQRDQFGQLVRVQFEQAGLQGPEAAGGGLDQQQLFVVGSYRALPAIGGTHARQAIDAGSQPLADQGFGDRAGAGRVGAAAKAEQDGFGHDSQPTPREPALQGELVGPVATAWCQMPGGP
jgi:hypothetical protein